MLLLSGLPAQDTTETDNVLQVPSGQHFVVCRRFMACCIVGKSPRWFSVQFKIQLDAINDDVVNSIPMFSTTNGMNRK